VLGRIFGFKRDEVTRIGGNYIMRVLLLTQYCSRDQTENEMGGHVERVEGFLWGNLRERHHLEEPGVDGS
jgi:hypothetical protein